MEFGISAFNGFCVGSVSTVMSVLFLPLAYQISVNGRGILGIFTIVGLEVSMLAPPALPHASLTPLSQQQGCIACLAHSVSIYALFTVCTAEELIHIELVMVVNS